MFSACSWLPSFHSTLKSVVILADIHRGSYPGRYPNDTGVGIPRGKKKTDTTKEPEVLVNFSGKLENVDDHRLVLKLDDARLITFKRTANTRFLPGIG